MISFPEIKDFKLTEASNKGIRTIVSWANSSLPDIETCFTATFRFGKLLNILNSMSPMETSALICFSVWFCMIFIISPLKNEGIINKAANRRTKIIAKMIKTFFIAQ